MWGRPLTPFAAHIVERRYPSVVELPGGAPFGLRYNLYLRWCREHCLPQEYAQTDRDGPKGERGYYVRFCFRTRKLAAAFAGYVRMVEAAPNGEVRQMCEETSAAAE